ncbi:hypothetical protein AB0F85_05545 [Nocardia fluminea]|uniref:hypothetical protein n=1 Tax=Nocardia fluminea TaxID=134984 RepID=UPI0033F6F7FC
MIPPTTSRDSAVRPTAAHTLISGAALTFAAAAAGPLVAGQLVLLGKPFGGVLGVPAGVVGYLGLTALAVGCVTAASAVGRALSVPQSAGAAVVAGSALIAAGFASGVWTFTVALVVAAALTGPLLISTRALGWPDPVASTWWQVAMVAGFAVAAATAALCQGVPGAALAGAGVAVAAGGGIAGSRSVPFCRAPRELRDRAPTLAVRAGLDNDDRRGPRSPRRGPSPRFRDGLSRPGRLAYAAIGFAVGGTVLPALHLLLFRWSMLGRDQALLMLSVTVVAATVMALPGPAASAVPSLLILAAGGPILVATAPGPLTATIGLAVTVAASARAARGLDLAAGPTAAPPDDPGGGTAGVTSLLVTVAAVAGFGVVSALGEFAGAGTSLTLLALPILAAALYYSRAAGQARADRPLEGGAA